MKKKIFFLITIIIIFCTGCARRAMNINIKNDGKVEVSDLIAIMDGYDTNGTIEQQKEKYEQTGYDVEEYSEAGFSGFRATRNDLNLDNFIFGEDYVATKKLFKYTIDFQPYTEEDLNDIQAYKDYFAQYGGYAKITINLPTKALSSNATYIYNNGKTLEWDLLSTPDPTIHVEFILITTNQMIVIAAVIAILILILALILFKKKKKNSQEYQVHHEESKAKISTPSISNISNQQVSSIICTDKIKDSDGNITAYRLFDTKKNVEKTIPANIVESAVIQDKLKIDGALVSEDGTVHIPCKLYQ